MTDLANRIRQLKQAHYYNPDGPDWCPAARDEGAAMCSCSAAAFNARVESIALAAEQVERETIERCAEIADAEAAEYEAQSSAPTENYTRQRWLSDVACDMRDVAANIRALLATEPEPAAGGKE